MKSKLLSSLAIIGSLVGLTAYEPIKDQMVGGMDLWKFTSSLLQPVVATWDVYAPANLRFDGEIQPDGSTCANGEILKKTGTNDWDCASDATGAGGSGTPLEVREIPGTKINPTATISFEGLHFSLAASGSAGDAVVRLDWGSGGPASLSQDESVTGRWNFNSGHVTISSSSDSSSIELRGFDSGSGHYLDLKPNNTGHYQTLRLFPKGAPTVGSSFEFYLDDSTSDYQRLIYVGHNTTGHVLAADTLGGSGALPIIFRVGTGDWDSIPNLLYLDTDSQVGIGKTPTNTLDVSGSASVSLNFEADGYASASFFRGTAFNITGNECSGDTDTLAWENGVFTCGDDDNSGGGGGVTIEVDDGLTDIGSFSSISFEPNSFVVTDTTGEVSVKLDWTTGPASKSAAQTITGLWTFSGGASFSGSVTGTIDTLVRFGATSAVPPSTSFATFDTRNDYTVLDFGDSAVASKSIFIDTMPYDYDDGSISVWINYSATSATSGNVVWDVEFERAASNSFDIDLGGWATAQTATCAVPGTAGIVVGCKLTFTNAQADGIKKGEVFRLRVSRDTTDAADTIGSDIELHSVILVQ